MAFGDVKSASGLEALNAHLADNSYVEGYVPSKADLSVFAALGKAPEASSVHAARWYRHIASFSESERAAWGGQACPLSAGAKTTTAPAAADDDDDDVDLFGSDNEEEDAEAAKIRDERLKAYASKKSAKPALIAKSSIVLDVKPWDDETDMKELEKVVRSVVMDGLLWGASKLVPVGYGINKLQICCVVEDEKVSIDLLCEEIQNFEEFVQSVDIAAFNKI